MQKKKKWEYSEREFERDFKKRYGVLGAYRRLGAKPSAVAF